VAGAFVGAAKEPAVIISMPSGPPTGEFVQLLASRFGPLWAQRQAVYVSNGQAYDAGDFRIRFGDVRQGQGSTQQARGTVVEVEWKPEDSGSVRLEAAEALIKGFWDALEIKGAKEYLEVPGVEKEDMADVRQWCEAMRLRG
jgi:hypothetical protein